MRVQIVHHQRDLLRSPVLPGDSLQKRRPVGLGFSFRDPDAALASQRFDRHEDVAHAAALVFVIVARGHPATDRQRQPCFANQLPRRFVHADHGAPGIVRPLVHVEHLFHLGDKVASVLGRNDPLLLFPRFQLVFFNTRRTVS